MIVVFKMLIKLLDQNNKRLPFIFMCFLVASIVDLISLAMFIPVISFVLFGEVSIDTKQSAFLQHFFDFVRDISMSDLAILLFMVFLIKSTMAVLIQYVIISFVNQQRVILGTKMFARYLDSGLRIGNPQREADQIYNLQTLTSHYTMAIQASLKFLNDALIGVVVLLVLIFVDWMVLALMVGTLASILLTYLVLFRRVIIEYGRKANEYNADAVRVSNEGIRGVNEIHFLQKKNYFLENFNAALRGVKKASIGIEIQGIMPRILVEMAIIILLVSALFLASSKIIDFKEFVLIFGIYAISVVRLIPIFSSLTSQVTRFRSVQNSIERLYNDVVMGDQSQKQLIKANDHQDASETFESILFKNVTFQYDEAKPIIHDFSLTIKKGEIIGLFGPSGSGKSTFVRLILGLLKPTKGKIYFNGKTIDHGARTETLGFAYIPQDAVMLNRSVLENVTFDLNADNQEHEKVYALLEKAHLGEVAKLLPNGLDEEVGDFGARFSAGQKQRLAFARVLAHDKSFFVLDESTNALDMKTEKALMEDLIKTGVIETALIVSHRPSTLEDCNYILDFSSDDIRVINNPKAFVAEIQAGRHAQA